MARSWAGLSEERDGDRRTSLARLFLGFLRSFPLRAGLHTSFSYSIYAHRTAFPLFVPLKPLKARAPLAKLDQDPRFLVRASSLPPHPFASAPHAPHRTSLSPPTRRPPPPLPTPPQPTPAMLLLPSALIATGLIGRRTIDSLISFLLADPPPALLYPTQFTQVRNARSEEVWGRS